MSGERETYEGHRMADSRAPFTPGHPGACAAAAMVEIRVVMSRLAPAERANFWKAVDLQYRAPSGSPMSMTDARPILTGVAQGLEAMFPPVWTHAAGADGGHDLPEAQAYAARGDRARPAGRVARTRRRTLDGTATGGGLGRCCRR